MSIHNFHNFSQAARWFERPFEYTIDRLVHRHAKAMVSVSAICAASLANRPAFRGSPKLAHIHNGIEFRPPTATRQALRASLGIAPDAPLCLMMGTYEVRKGHEFLLRAFARVVKDIPAARLLICGFGYPAEVERVRKAVEESGLQAHVLLEGFREDVPDLLAASDLLLVPSQSSESFGLTIIEAMSRALPVVATRVGGMPEVLQDGHGGYLVASDDVEDLSRKMRILLADEKLRREQGQLGLAHFNQYFGAERMAAAYAQLLRSSEDAA